MRPRPVQAVLVLAFLGLASVASAATFDLIWTDHVTVTTYPFNSGFLTPDDIALVVNKGSTDISGAEFVGASITGTSSNPAVHVDMFVYNYAVPDAPIHSNEAIGAVDTNVLTAKLLPGETLGPIWEIALSVTYPPNYSGSAQLDLAMTIGGDVAHYSIQVMFVAGSSFAISFDRSARTSAVPVATPVRPTTWGRLKRLYR